MCPPYRRTESSSWDPSLSLEQVEELLDEDLATSAENEGGRAVGDGVGTVVRPKKGRKKKVKQDKVSEVDEVCAVCVCVVVGGGGGPL